MDNSHFYVRNASHHLAGIPLRIVEERGPDLAVVEAMSAKDLIRPGDHFAVRKSDLARCEDREVGQRFDNRWNE